MQVRVLLHHSSSFRSLNPICTINSVVYPLLMVAKLYSYSTKSACNCFNCVSSNFETTVWFHYQPFFSSSAFVFILLFYYFIILKIYTKNWSLKGRYRSQRKEDKRIEKLPVFTFVFQEREGNPCTNTHIKRKKQEYIAKTGGKREREANRKKKKVSRFFLRSTSQHFFLGDFRSSE